LVLAMRLSPDKVLGLAGIGPKAMQAIENAVAEMTKAAEVETPVEVEVPSEPEAGEAVEAAAPVEGEAVPEAIEGEVKVEEPVDSAAEETLPEISFEELFKLRSDGTVPSTEEEEKSDKKNKKGKKSVEYQFDEDRGEVVGRKKHKRGDAEWTGEDW